MPRGPTLERVASAEATVRREGRPGLANGPRLISLAIDSDGTLGLTLISLARILPPSPRGLRPCTPPPSVVALIYENGRPNVGME